jgi:hypothetical protein
LPDQRGQLVNPWDGARCSSCYGEAAQFERPEDLTRDVTAVKAAIKHLSPIDRAQLIAWMLLYYQDDGALFSPQVGRRRDRIALNGTEFWLARVPKRPRNT